MADGPFMPRAPQERTTPWAAIGFGVVFVFVLGALIWLVAGRHTSGRAAASPYALNLQLSGTKLSTAQNFVGATVIYVDGSVRNNGDKTVTHATVQAEFRDSLNEVVLREQQTLMVTAERPGYSDALDLSRAPLKPGESRPFRLTYEGVPGAWNQQSPDLRVLQVSTQ